MWRSAAGRARSAPCSRRSAGAPATRRTASTPTAGTGWACAPRRARPRWRSTPLPRPARCAPRRGETGPPWALGVGAGAARRRRRPERLRAARTRSWPTRWRRHPHLRIGRTGRVMEALVPAIIEQKVTGQEAFARLPRAGAPVRRAGARRRGRRSDCGSSRPRRRCAPSRRGSGCGCTSTRPGPGPSSGRPRVAGSLERLVALSGDEADRRLRSLPGVGGWTSAEVRSAGARRRRRGELRRLPPRQGGRLGAARARHRRRRSWPSPRALPAAARHGRHCC